MRRKSIFLVILAIIVIALSGCNKNGAEKIEAQLKEPTTSSVGNEFNIEYGFWIGNKNIFSTYDSYIQKDLITAGTAKEEWKISDGDLKEIEELVREYEIYKIDKKITGEVFANDGKSYLITPMEYFYIKLSIDGKEYYLEGDWTIHEVVGISEEASKVSEFLKKLRVIMMEQEVYKNMPEAEGGYE